MRLLIVTALTLALTASPGLVAEEKEKSQRFIYSTYFYCKASGEDKVDELVKKNTVPINDAAVADGTILGWGWLAHHTGGKWRRIQYHLSDSIDGLLNAQDVLQQRAEEAGVSNDGFGQICGAHDDYIWEIKSGNGVDSDRAKAGLSVYHVCNINLEERSDEIVEKVFAPVYNKAVEEGKITSWGWSAHVVGGKYRRLGTMTGEDYPSLMKAWGEILDELYADGKNAEAIEFSSICTSHSDYLWDIQHEAHK